MNGSAVFDGYIGQLQRHEIDILVGSITSVPVREEHFTFLRPIARMQGAILILDVQENSFLNILMRMVRQLEPNVWALFIASYGVVCVLRWAASVNYVFKTKLPVTLTLFILTMLFMNMYKLMLTSSYLRKSTRDISTMNEAVDEILSTNKKIIVPSRNGLAHSFVKNSKSFPMVRLRQGMDLKNTVFFGENTTFAKHLIETNQAYYITIDKNDQFDLEKGNCQLKSILIDAESEYISFNTFLVNQNDTELVHLFNNAMNQLKIPSILPLIEDVYFRDIIYRRHQCRTLQHQSEKMLSAVRIDTFIGPLIAMVIVFAVSMFILFVERFTVCFIHKYLY